MEPYEPSTSIWASLRPLFAIVAIVAAGVGIVTIASSLGSSIGDRLASDDTSVTVEPGVAITVEIPAGSTGQDIAAILEENGVVASAAEFEATIRSEGLDGSLRAGSYDLETGMAPRAVASIMAAGPVVQVYDITIREGLRVTEILDVLAEGSGIDRSEFETALFGGGVDTSIVEIPESSTFADWEGLLFPDTYRFSEAATAGDILNRMASTMEQRMDAVDWSELEAAGYTQYQGIIIASLVEAEVRVPDERSLVSSVIENRLTDGQLLQIDATVLYGLGTRDPALFNNEDDSPYNTYLEAGLPPTPIAAPGLASLQAAASPADTVFRYYVLADENGAHAFAETFEEHLVNVAAAREAGLLGG